MMWPIGPCAVLADLLILLVLIAAAAGRRLPKTAQPLVATLAFVCAWILAGALDALHAPVWTLSMSGGVIVTSAAALAVIVYLAAPQADGGGGGRGHDDGGGGPDGPPEHGPQGGGADGDPSWWPQFERDFARYVALCQREKREILVPVAAVSD